jgi:hypothetical protein
MCWLSATSFTVSRLSVLAPAVASHFVRLAKQEHGAQGTWSVLNDPCNGVGCRTLIDYGYGTEPKETITPFVLRVLTKENGAGQCTPPTVSCYGTSAYGRCAHSVSVDTSSSRRLHTINATFIQNEC